MDSWKSIAHLSPQQTKALQSKKLQHFINTHLYPFSPHYKKIFNNNKINPKHIRSVEDLKHVPFSSKRDFINKDNPAAFRDFILQPDQAKIKEHWAGYKLLNLALVKAVRGQDYVAEKLGREYRPIFTTFTTGTTNDPVPFVYTGYDIQNLYLSGSRMLELFDVGNKNNIVNMFPFAPHLAFWQVVFGGLSSKVLILSTGGGKVMGTEGNISALLKMKPAVILGVPSYVYHVLCCAREKGCRMDFVKKVILGASRVTDAFKLRLVSLLSEMGATDVSVFGTYGFTEARSAWGECPTKAGVSSGYHLYPDKEIFEIIDPQTGEIKAEGEDGEIVYTSLDARGSIVVRYRTGDFVKGGITYAQCPHCGRCVPRISSDITRLSDVKDLKLSKIKGSLVNLNNFASALSEFDCISEWQIEICKKDNDPYSIDQLIVYLSVKDGTNQDALESDLRKKVLVATEVTPNKIVFLPFQEMVKRLELETASKEKRIVDSRPKE